MNVFIESHHEVLTLLVKHQVDFMLIGGYAVIFYGYNRTTGDMDLWLKPDNHNKLKFCNAMEEAGYDKEGIEFLKTKNFEEGLVFSLGTEPQRIDFLTFIDLVSYAEADKMKVIGEIDGIQLPVIHLNNLILSKINTGRSKDQADIEELQRIHHLK